MAMAFATLAPTVSNAIAAAAGRSAWAEVCTAEGARWVRLDAADADVVAANASRPAPAHSLASHFESCPYCGFAQHGVAPPPQPSAWAAATARRDMPPAHVGVALRAANPWRGIQPRAPPPLS